jgi:tetratricopeptide (TPR) repeat protein
VLEDLGRWGESKAAFNQAVKASGGKQVEAIFRLGLALHRDGDYKAAVEHYRKAIEISGDRIPACHNNLGVVMVALGRFDQAEREFETALEQSKNGFDDARHNLRLCRSLLASYSPALVAELKVTGAAQAAALKTE